MFFASARNAQRFLIGRVWFAAKVVGLWNFSAHVELRSKNFI
jgi:hypothetical protein